MRDFLLGVGLLSAALVACSDGPQGFTGTPYDYGPGAGSSGGGSGGSSGGAGGASSSGSGGSGGGHTGSSSGGTVATTCTSGVFYSGSGDDGSSSMAPGEACGSCHKGGELSAFSVAGTVYPSPHEATDCNGVDVSGATVVITDAMNTVVTLTLDRVGNFSTRQTIVTPYKASVVYGGHTLDMISAQTSGDCNSCHSATGTGGAPGRILLP